jgi:hypothetical protein
MFEVSITKYIQCPLDSAFLYVSNFENDAEWWPGVIEAARLTPERQLGARYRQKNRVLGITYALTLRVDEYVHNSKISFRSDKSAIVFSGEYLFLETPAGTALTMNAKVEANHVLFRAFHAVFKRAIQRMTEKNFNALKNVLEQRFPMER